MPRGKPKDYFINIELVGQWGHAQQAIVWHKFAFVKAFQNAMMKEASRLNSIMKQDFQTGGNPRFALNTPFTLYARAADGWKSVQPGFRSGKLFQNIRVKRINRGEVFTGVMGNTKNMMQGKFGVAGYAELFENGQPARIIALDIPGKTGKTPRQWLTWMFLSGHLPSLPKKSTTHIRFSETPPRPFVKPVYESEKDNILVNMMNSIYMEFLASNFVPSLHVP